MRLLPTIATLSLAAAALSTAHTVHAQPLQVVSKPSASVPTPSADTTGKIFAGVWEGLLHTDHTPDAPVKLTFSMTPEFGVMVNIAMGGNEVVDGPASELKASGASVSWKQPIMQMTCATTASLGSGGELKGQIDCGHVTASFVARRK